MDSTALTRSDKKNLYLVILASSVGTMIEWYDFYLFGILATILSTEFFPAGNPTAAYLATLATFAAGFIVRPFGALVFGRLGDLAGRKHTFLITLIIMGASTFAIGLVPGYAQIGIAATIIITLLRLIQGLALGGEYGGAATYVAEHAPANKRGFYTSFIQTTATLGLLLSIGIILLVRSQIGSEAFTIWGWRIPFLMSAILVGVSVFIRMKMNESPLFTALKESGKLSKNPIKESFGNSKNLKLVLIALFGATAGQGVVWYTGQFYAMSFLEKTCQLEFEQTRYIMATALLIGTPLFIYFGWLSDKYGRKIIMLTGLILAVIMYRPIYTNMYIVASTEGKIVQTEAMLTPDKKQINYSDGTTVIETRNEAKTSREIILNSESYWNMVMYILIQVVFVAMVYGPIAAFLVEMFPIQIRYTSMSVPYHLGNGVFGGLTPFIASSLFASSINLDNPTGNPLVGLWYPIGVAFFTFIIGLIFLKNRRVGDVTN